MIYQSEYWKDLLLKNAKFLRAMAKRERWTDALFAKLEQVIFLSFYALRKLNDCNVLSNSTIERQIIISAFKSKGKPVTKLNWHRIEQLYDFDEKEQLKISTIKLYNQFIHSYVFLPFFDSKGKFINGILFCSDKERNRRLYLIRMSQIIKLLEMAGRDYPNRVQYKFDPKISDYRFYCEMKKG